MRKKTHLRLNLFYKKKEMLSTPGGFLLFGNLFFKWSATAPTSVFEWLIVSITLDVLLSKISKMTMARLENLAHTPVEAFVNPAKQNQSFQEKFF